MERKQMAEEDSAGSSSIWLRLRVPFLTVVLLALIGYGLGYTMAVMRHGHGLDSTHGLQFALIILAILGCGWLLLRQAQASSGKDRLTSKERLNRNLTIASGLLGGVVALILAFADRNNLASGGIFSSGPLTPMVSILLILIVGLLVPAITLYWHKIIDEQEAHAYRTGALVGLYVYAIGAPVWWLAWRGGFVPAPNGFIIYFATIFTLGGVWLWKKYA